MKNYRNAVVALVLAMVFSTPAFAEDGIIHTEKNLLPLPTPPPVNSTVWTGTTTPAPEADVLTEIALNLFQNLLILL